MIVTSIRFLDLSAFRASRQLCDRSSVRIPVCHGYERFDGRLLRPESARAQHVPQGLDFGSCHLRL